MSARKMLMTDTRRWASEGASSAQVRRLQRSDHEGLARLMIEAYRGTIDDEGETLDDARAEVGKTFAGGYGEMLWECSWVVPGTAAESLDSATVVTHQNGAPLLAFEMTRADSKRTGLGERILRATLAHMAHGPHDAIYLVVTRGNTPAERMYEKLGFVEVDPKTRMPL
jgi:GNAT superfamily N-acetyltransferase